MTTNLLEYLPSIILPWANFKMPLSSLAQWCGTTMLMLFVMFGGFVSAALKEDGSERGQKRGFTALLIWPLVAILFCISSFFLPKMDRYPSTEPMSMWVREEQLSEYLMEYPEEAGKMRARLKHYQKTHIPELRAKLNGYEVDPDSDMWKGRKEIVYYYE